MQSRMLRAHLQGADKDLLPTTTGTVSTHSDIYMQYTTSSKSSWSRLRLDLLLLHAVGEVEIFSDFSKIIIRQHQGT